MPLVEQAKTAVSGLTKSNISDIRNLLNPPDPVKHVLKAVLAVFGSRDESWNNMKNFLKGCQDQIMNFDIKTNMTENVRKEVEAIINSHANSFKK